MKIKKKHGYQIDAMQEAFAIGFANVVGAFFRKDFAFNK